MPKRKQVLPLVAAAPDSSPRLVVPLVVPMPRQARSKVPRLTRAPILVGRVMMMTSSMDGSPHLYARDTANGRIETRSRSMLLQSARASVSLGPQQVIAGMR
jgi:hypothetical protein